jgi:hypothetical protein
LDGADVVFSALDNVTFARCIVYLDSGVDATSYLIGYFDDAAEFPVTANGGDVTIVWNTEGIVQLAST